tara:strand:+ start:1799 stop:2083 length:285 start_codon:yes stop_codon:yes gene_type:complete
VADGVLQQLGGLARDARHETTGVDHGVPTLPLQRLQTAVAILSEMLDLRVETGVGLASIEEGDRVLVGEGGVDESATQECDTTEDEQAHIRCPG